MNNPIYRSIEGRRICFAMKMADVNQVELAAKIGVTQSYISQIVLGKCTLSDNMAKKISGALGVPVEYLKGGMDFNPAWI